MKGCFRHFLIKGHTNVNWNLGSLLPVISVLSDPPPQSYFLFISISCFPIQLLTCVSMYSMKVWKREKEKDGINERMCLYLNVRGWRKREQGGFKSSSGLWWKAKIKLPAAAISAVWLSTHLFFFSLHTSPNHLLFPLRHCMCMCTASEFYYFINFSHSMGESRAGRHVYTSTFFWSLSQKKSIPTGRGSGVSACGGARNRARGGTTAVVVANLNHRYLFQSLLLGGTTDKSIITLNRGGGSLDVLRCQGPWKSSRSTCPFTPFFISSCRAHAKWSS